MESQPQNPEFRIYPETFTHVHVYHASHLILINKSKKQCLNWQLSVLTTVSKPCSEICRS